MKKAQVRPTTSKKRHRTSILAEGAKHRAKYAVFLHMDGV